MKLALHVLELLDEGFELLLRSFDVGSLAADAARGARRGGGAADVADARQLAPEERAQDGRADRDGRSQTLLLELLGFLVDLLLGGSNALVQSRELGPVAFAQLLEREVSLFVQGLPQANSKVALGLVGSETSLRRLQLKRVREWDW